MQNKKFQEGKDFCLVHVRHKLLVNEVDVHVLKITYYVYSRSHNQIVVQKIIIRILFHNNS
jgi:hypothetical protein